MATFMTGGLKHLPIAVIALTLLELCTSRSTSAFNLVQPVSLTPATTAQENQWLPCFDLPGCLALSPATPDDLPEAISTGILQDTAERAELPVSKLRIIDVQRVIWSDGCMGNYQPEYFCTMALVGDWAIISGTDRQQWIYSADNFMANYIGTFKGSAHQSEGYPDDFALEVGDSPSAAVPEPSSVLGLLLAGLTGFKLRQRERTEQ